MMNIATISPISIQLDLVSEYDPIFMLTDIKMRMKLKVCTFKYQNAAWQTKMNREKQTD